MNFFKDKIRKYVEHLKLSLNISCAYNFVLLNLNLYTFIYIRIKNLKNNTKLTSEKKFKKALKIRKN